MLRELGSEMRGIYRASTPRYWFAVALVCAGLLTGAGLARNPTRTALCVAALLLFRVATFRSARRAYKAKLVNQPHDD